VDSAERKFTVLARRCYGAAGGWLLRGLFFLLSLGGLVTAGAMGTDMQSAPVPSLGTGLAIADLDGDLRPDLADVQVGRSDVSLTDYWIQVQLTAAGHQTILVVAPSGGLQIATRDVNGDQALDLVLTTTWLRQPVAILLNDGHGGFSRVDPSAFPGAFSEAKTNWSSHIQEAPDLVGVPPQSREGICPAVARLPQESQVAGIPPSHCGFARSPFLISHQGRAPPSEVLHL
jgi:hypothetical protein